MKNHKYFVIHILTGGKIILILMVIIKQRFYDGKIWVRGWKPNWISRVMQSITYKNCDSIKTKTDAWQAEYITILVFGRFDKYATKTVKNLYENSKKPLKLEQIGFWLVATWNQLFSNRLSHVIINFEKNSSGL